MSLGPFDLTGEPFLALYIGLFATTILAGLIIPRRLRPAGRTQRVEDIDQLAYLSGGVSRFGEAVVTRLLAAHALVMADKKSFRAVSRDHGGTVVERSVLAIPAPIGWSDIQSVLKSYREPLERRMIGSGLMMDKSEIGNIRFWTLLPYLMLLAFGATKWIIGDMRDRPVGYLTGLLIATALFALIRLASLDRRTEAGQDAVKRAKSEAKRLKGAPTNSEVGLAVALFGTTVLAGSAWADFHRMRQANGDGGSGGGDGDGGGCGGGCGGCGG